MRSFCLGSGLFGSLMSDSYGCNGALSRHIMIASQKLSRRERRTNRGSQSVLRNMETRRQTPPADIATIRGKVNDGPVGSHHKRRELNDSLAQAETDHLESQMQTGGLCSIRQM